MQKYVSATPNAEVIGMAAVALLKNLLHEEIAPLLVKHGLENIDPKQWYPEQKVLDLLKDIGEGQTNVSENLVAIGMKAVETIPFPPEIDTLEKFMVSYGARQVASSRNTTAILVSELVGPKHGRVINDTPYPDDMIYGYIWGAGRRFLPHGSQFTVRTMAKANPEDPTVFDITW